MQGPRLLQSSSIIPSHITQTIARRSLSAEEIKGLAAQRPPVEPEASSTATAEESKDGHLLDAISLTRKCLRSLPMDTVRGAVDPAVVQSVLGLVVGDASASAWGLPVRVAATRLAAALLPFVDDKTLSQVQLPGAPAPPKTSNSSSLAGLGPVDGHFKGKRAALVALVLEAAGAFLVAPHVLGAAGASAADSTVLESVESAESRAGLAHQRLALLRSLALAWSKGWADAVVEVVAQVLVDLPELLAQLGTGATTEDAAAEDGSIEGALARPLAMAAAVLALLGGDAEGLAVGADVLVKAAERKGCAEEGVVLALAHAEGDKDQAPRGLGGAVVVALRSDPTRPQVLPRERVTPQPCRDQAAFLRLFIGEQAGLDTMLASFRCLVGHELRGGSPHLYAPKLVEEVQTHVVESPHPHERGADLQVPLRFPGAKSIDVVFDEQSRTAWGKAHVQFLKEEDSLEWFGKEKYQGRDREQCWAGAHGAPKLVIPAASCVVRFVSDGHEEPDWGFKLTARAHTVREVAPPELPPSGRYAARAQLCMQGTKALTAVLQTAPPLGQPAAAAGLLRALVGSALAGNDGASGSSSSSSQARGRYRRRATPLELESGHPYSNNEERFEEVAFPGAKRLVVRFDPRSSTEKGCDFVRFYKDESRSAYWGVAQYTGSKDGSAALWPGVGACPPLVISSDRCVLYFHSDGSVVDWGFRCWVMPDYRDLDGLENMGLAEVGARVFTLHQCLCDGAKPQTVPAGVAWFRRLPSGALPSAVRSITTTGPDGGEEDEEALAALCGGLSVGEAASASTDTGEPQDEDAAVLALAKAQSRAKVVGRRFVVNRHDAGTVTVRAAPHPVAPMVGMLDDCDQPVLALEERGEWMRIDWWALPTPAVAWVQRRRSDHILMVPVDEVGGGQDALLVLPNEELEDDDAGVQPGRANSMYECADVALVDTAAVASASASTARSDGENLHPAECVHGQQARLRSALTELQLHAARGYAKRSVTALLLQWPETEPLDLGTAFGSPQVFLRFLATAFQDEQQRAVAAAASAGGGGGVPGAGEDSPLLQVLRRTIRQVLADEREGGRGDGDGAAFARTLLAYPLRQLREAAGLYASVTPTRGLVKPFQTPHPYPNNADLSWKVSFPGASRLKLVWDARSSTEPNCDYFVLYRDADHSDDNRVSPVHYSGRVNDMEASWPGVGGRPPLYVDSDHVDIVFRSDASNNDWGAKVRR